LRDGELVAAAFEEALTRVKHDARLPSQAFRYCLAEGGLDIGDVDIRPDPVALADDCTGDVSV
jgi:carbamoyltransferase